MPKKFLIVVIVFIILITSALVYLKFSKKKPEQKFEQQKVDQTVLDAQQKSAELVTQINEIAKTDWDLDGILDVDEAKYGTSASSSDTDKDGLLDKSEIEQFKTDPLNADTDKDGFKDGYEVRRGFNPNGRGQLK